MIVGLDSDPAPWYWNQYCVGGADGVTFGASFAGMAASKSTFIIETTAGFGVQVPPGGLNQGSSGALRTVPPRSAANHAMTLAHRI